MSIQNYYKITGRVNERWLTVQVRRIATITRQEIQLSELNIFFSWFNPHGLQQQIKELSHLPLAITNCFLEGLSLRTAHHLKFVTASIALFPTQ